jgi:CheY-like chemotaxis protein
MPCSVLIADDQPSVRSLLIRLIRRTEPHAQIIDVADGYSALQMYQTNHPTIVLLDHGLPDINGFVVLDQLKAMPQAPYIIVITGDPGLEQEALRHGADDVWLKPMDVGQMMRQLAELLPKHQQ